MTLRKSNKVVHIPKCVYCPRDTPSFSGECFIAIPSQLNLNGKWMGSHWHLFCGNCFQELIKGIKREKEIIGEVDFVNLFLNNPITIFKEKYKTRIEFKDY
ncbi:hypothetical protein LCGC14_0494930 [marine sediment metagenome]|uniref:Uncharacterized protein n=1 Tax=marine sediment metagenome TaxID=412755 RepID=A0A0F9USC0_9ZZZZ